MWKRKWRQLSYLWLRHCVCDILSTFVLGLSVEENLDLHVPF